MPERPLIISDGGDNCSRHTMADLKNLLRETDVQVCALGIFNSWENRSQIPRGAIWTIFAPHCHETKWRSLIRDRGCESTARRSLQNRRALRAQYGLGYSEGSARRKGSPRRSEACSAQKIPQTAGIVEACLLRSDRVTGFLQEHESPSWSHSPTC